MSRYLATFFPQIIEDGHTRDVEPLGPCEWDCSMALRRVTKARRQRALNSRSARYPDEPLAELQRDPDAPAWIQAWRGPFVIAIEPLCIPLAVMVTPEEHDDPSWRATAPASRIQGPHEYTALV